MTCNNDAFLFDRILQQQGGFPTGLSSDTRTSIGITTGLKMEMDSSPDSSNLHGSGSPLSDDVNSRNDLSSTKRKYHNKSRNGCATCKKRRVKCDEAHPVCKKCSHMKIECVYLPVEKKVRRKKKEILEERARRARQHLSVRDGAFTSIPSIKVDDLGIPPQNSSHYAATSPTLTNTSMHHKNDSISSLMSSHSSPLSTATIKQEHSQGLSSISPQVTQSSPSNTEDKTAAMLMTAAQQMMQGDKLDHMANGTPGSSTIAAAMSAIPSAQLAQLAAKFMQGSPSDLPPQLQALAAKFTQGPPSEQAPPVTPQAIQKKIQQAQEYQKQRAKKFQEYANKSEPNLSPSVTSPQIAPSPLTNYNYSGTLNMLDLRLMFHYTTKVWPTITAAGISEERIWSEDIPALAFNYPFLMHSILAFSATHLSRTERGLDQCVTCHRGDALRLLREAVLEISPQNTDALVASALILIMDSLANASLPTSTSPKSLPASAWIFHVKGAATILTAVWPLNESSRFYKFIGVDLGDLGDIINKKTRGVDVSSEQLAQAQLDNSSGSRYSSLQCFDDEIADLYPVPYDSPYLVTLAYLNKLHNERYKSDFILRIFAFPALLDKVFLGLLITGDISAMRIMRSYYTLLRSFTTEMKDKVWFLEGVSKVLPVDVEQYSGGGGMHMMLDFLGGPSTLDVGGDDDDAESFSDLKNGLLNPDNLPSTVTNNMDVMQGDNEFM